MFVSVGLADIILYLVGTTDTMNPLASLPNKLYKRILEKKGKLDSAGRLPDDVAKRIDARMQVEFVYNTNKIEGNTLGRGETELILRGLTVKNQNLASVLAGKNISDVLAVQNHPDAIKFVKELAFSPRLQITEEHIRKLHKATMNGLMGSAGQYRQFDIQVKGAGFTPPPFYLVPDEMKELVGFINQNPGELRPIELAAHAHYYLAWIHPFEDGNGRIARLLLNLILIRNGYPFAVIRNVDRKKYLETLRRADLGEFEPFLNFVARCAEQTLDLYLLEMQGIKGKKARLLPLSELAKGTPYSSEYLSLLARKGVIDAVKEGRLWKTTRETITSYVDQRKHRRS
jgi:Fic family protein